MPAAENQFLNDVQHKLNRPLNNDKAVTAGAAANLKCLTYTSPLFANAHMPDTTSFTALSDEDHELMATAMAMATPQSVLCQAEKAQQDRENAEAAAAQARAEADARARKEAQDRQYTEQRASVERKVQQDEAELRTKYSPSPYSYQSPTYSTPYSISSGGMSWLSSNWPTLYSAVASGDSSAVSKAISNSGSDPAYHYKIMSQFRSNYPSDAAQLGLG